MKPEDLVVAALQEAERAGVTIRRGTVFDWSRRQTSLCVRGGSLPSACNWLGAVLLFTNMVFLVGPEGFAATFLPEVLKVLDVDHGWVWRFSHGFDYGNCLNFTYTDKDGKDKKTVTDKLSLWANQLAKRVVKDRS